MYRGTRWYKCDFHLHTSASLCFEDTAITPEEFIEKVIEQKLDCIAITDHNNGSSIDAIKRCASARGIIVFPGVEITCSDAKIHLLIIFDIDKSSADVEDFLIELGIRRTDFGQENAHVHKEVFDVLKKAKDVGAIVIPAHIDEYNGLSNVSNESKKKCFESELILGVQFVHEDLLKNTIDPSQLESIVEEFKDYYHDENINIEKIKTWKSCSEYVKKISRLTFSDNPKSERSSKHGLWGIGKKYSWIKMNETPNLESLRQALLVPELRVRNYYESVECPYTTPDIWIKSLRIEKISSQGTEPIEFEFSPQMTTIIGGRGSGKSTILHLLRGLFKKYKDVEGISSISTEFNEFYKITDSRGKGILTEDTTITGEIYLNGTLYKVTASNIKNVSNQTIVIERFNVEDESYEVISNPEFLNLFNFSVYSQKQIYEVAQKPNVLREQIDSGISEITPLKKEIESIKEEYISLSADIRSFSNQLEARKIFEAEVQEKDIQINAFKESGVADLLEERKNFSNDIEEFETLKNGFVDQLEKLSEFVSGISTPLIEVDKLSRVGQQEYLKTYNFVDEKMNQIKNALVFVNDCFTLIKDKIEKITTESDWKRAFDDNKSKIEAKKLELSEKGVANIENFEKILEEKEIVNKKLVQLDKYEVELRVLHEKRNVVSQRNIEVSRQISSLRSKFLNSLPLGENVEIKINQYRDKENYENEIRNIIQKNTGFEDSINCLLDKCFSGRLPDNLQLVHNDLDELRSGNIPEGYDGHFRNLINKLDDSQFEKLKLIIPEDQIFARYKPAGTNIFKNISNASAGQKTSTVLTYLLSYGNMPLVLDQPEDDLDNHLVYGLIVDRLSKSKENRQIIVITHNANIPVNGDAEFVMAMNSQSKYIKISHKGTIEEKLIKDEICEVMEGGETAFSLRAKRYNFRS